MSLFKVGLFRRKGAKGVKYIAYTVWYDPDWNGCEVFEVEAPNGTQAKKRAIEMARAEDAQAQAGQP